MPKLDASQRRVGCPSNNLVAVTTPFDFDIESITSRFGICP
jgi:hypothetical protein